LNIRQFKHARKLHQVVGLTSAVFFIVLAVSGVLLMHYDTLGLNGKVVSGRFLPEKYFSVDSAKPAIQALAISRQGTGYAGTAHGLYRREGDGAWAAIKEGLFNQDIRTLAIDPANPRVVYAGTQGGLFRSDDGGDTFADWFDASSGLTNGEIISFTIHPRDSDRLYAGTAGGLFMSDDGGEFWALAFAPPDEPAVHGIVPSAGDPDHTLYLLAARGTYRSEDGGKTWQPVWGHALPPLTALVSLHADPEFLYAAAESGLYKSFNGGRSWVKDTGISSPHTILPSPADLSTLTLATEKGAFTTRDGGDTWQATSPLPDTRSRLTQLAAGGKWLLAGTPRGLFASSDGGNHWQETILNGTADAGDKTDRQMDLVKLITEIHTGRFFGNYFMLLVDLATVGLVALVVTGFMITFYRKKVKSRKKDETALEVETDREIVILETASDLSDESLAIHDMIEHIGNHLEKCKSVYLSREKKEIDEIGRHITTLDRKVHHLMERLGELEDISRSGK